jgi:hypothetical protein
MKIYIFFIAAEHFTLKAQNLKIFLKENNFIDIILGRTVNWKFSEFNYNQKDLANDKP